MVVEALVIPAFLDVSPEDGALDAFSWNRLHLVGLAGLFPGNRLFFGLCTVCYSFVLGGFTL